MNKVLRCSFLFIFMLQLCSNQVLAEIIWGNKISTFRVLSGAHFNISTTSFSVQGTFEKETDSILSGNPLTFDGGIFVNEGSTLSLTGTLSLDSNQLLDASGAALVFLNPDNQQINIQKNQTFSLQNIVYSRINESTFQFGENSTLNIGSGVIWEVSEDLILSQANIVLTGTADTFIIRGVGGKKRLTLPYNSSISLRSNTVVLEDIEFIGLENVQVGQAEVDGEQVVGAIALSGQSIVHVTADSMVNFVAEGMNNELRLAKKDIFLGGMISFSDDSKYNQLHINPAILDQGDILPQVYLGDNCISIASDLGFAELIFDKPINIINTKDSSFTLGDHSYLNGKFLGVLQNPIKQTSALVSIDQGLVLTSDQLNAVNTAVIKALTRFDLFDTRPTTALHLHRKRNREKIPLQPEYGGNGVFIKPYAWQANQASSEAGLKKRKQGKIPAVLQNIINRQKHRSFDDVFKRNSFVPTEEESKKFASELDVTRSFLTASIPPKTLTSFKTRSIETGIKYDVKYLNTVKLGDASGVILLDGAQATEFNASQTDPLTLTLKNNASLIQGFDDVVINSGNSINVVGAGNKITVVNNFTLEGSLQFEQGAVLTIEFSNQGEDPTFTFASANPIVLEPGVVLEFKGRGTVKCSDGSFFTLSDVPSSHITPSFIMRDGALLTLLEDATVTFSGTGKINLMNNGGIDLNVPSQIIIGNSATDNIDVIVQGGNILLDLGESTTVPQANLSFPQGKYSLQVTSGGLISVGDGGRLEFNTLDGQAYSTYEKKPSALIKSISLTPGGIFRVDGGGQVIFGENKRTDVAGPGLVGTEIDFSWDSLATRFGGSGFIGYVNQDNENLAFMGQLQSNSSAIALRTRAITAEELVKNLVQTKPTLTVSTLFVDIDGNNAIRTVDGVIVTLDKNVKITGDDSDGNIFLFNNKTEEASTINSAGE